MRLFRIWFSFLIGTLAATVLQGQVIPAQQAQFTCGLDATYIYLNRAGHHVAYDELVRDFLEENPPDSLLAIRNVLAKHGCPTVAVKADPDYFLDRKEPAIVYVELDGYSFKGERHFTYMAKATKENGVEFRDPIFDANHSSFMTYDTFARIFKGIALVAHE